MADSVMTKAMFAAGCFWGVEEHFRQIPGVCRTAVGYAGGHVADPDYAQVCRGDTGHAETVLVEFDATVIGYEALLAAFWACHNPTQHNRQGPDIGTQYRTVIFTSDAEQAQLAEKSRAALAASGRYHRPIATQIQPAAPFYRAEEYHQTYIARGGAAQCGV